MLSHQTIALDIHAIDKAKEFAAFLQPDVGQGGALEILHPPIAVHDDGSRALDEQKIFFQLIQLIHFAFRVGEHRERQVQNLYILLRLLKRVTQNDNDLGARFFELFVKFPQLGNMRTAFHSDIFANEEQNHIVLPAKIRERDLLSVRCFEFEVWRNGTDLGIDGIC